MKQHRIAGLVLIATSLGFVAVFSYLAARFGYPEVLDGTAERVLPAFIAGGAPMRWIWAVYAVLPMGVALSATLAFPLFRSAGETTARLGLVAAVVSAFAMTAGLARWPTFHYALGQRFVKAGSEERQLLSTLFDALNLYLGNVTGEFIGEILLSTWFLSVGLGILRGIGVWRWVGYLGLFTAFAMTVGAFRNVTTAVDVVAALDNSLLPLWLIVLGAALMSTRSSSTAGSDNISP
jgi:hypothetical protein